jgi:hypothetical protein
MRADAILRQVLAEVAGLVHRARLNAVTDSVLALIDGGEVALSALGRSISPRSQKHGIKRIDRLLGNPALYDERELFYRAIAAYVLRSTHRPVILVDWTKTGDTTCTLTAALPVQGRAVVIHAVTVPLSKWTSRALEDLFLLQLQAMIGEDRKPILVGDAGFRAPWMRSVQKLGWDFVVRIRGRTKLQRVDDHRWQPWKALWPQSRRRPRCLGKFNVTKNRSVETNVVTVDQRSPHTRSTTPRPRSTVPLKAAKACREPLFLATTLSRPAKEIVAIYASRMQIELAFRDLKSHRFGWGFEDARCRSPMRIAIQIMLATLASVVCMLVGIAIEAAGLHKRFQANTTTKRRVLSLVWLGRAAIRTLDCLHELPFLGFSRCVPFVGIP